MVPECVFTEAEAAEWAVLRQAIQLLQRETRTALPCTVAPRGALTLDARHNALTLKVVLGLNTLAALSLPQIVNSYALQFQWPEKTGRRRAALKLLGVPAQTIPLIDPLAADVRRVLNPNRTHQASAFGWRECGRFVPLHPVSLQRRWQRLGVRELRGGRWLRAYLRAHWRQSPATLAEIGAAQFCAAAQALARGLGWEPAPTNWQPLAGWPSASVGVGGFSP